MVGNIAPQNEWEASRLGKLTASKISQLLVKPRGSDKIAKGTITYLLDKVTEIATGTTRQVSNYAIEWGNEHEPVAAQFFKQHYPDFKYLGKNSPEFFEYSDFSGGSPDGYSLDAKMVGEIKCPENPANHTRFLRMDGQDEFAKSEPDYYAQLQFNMMCVAKKFGFEFTDMRGVFLSYCPEYKAQFEGLQYYPIEVTPDMDLHDKIVAAIPNAEEVLGGLYSELLEKAKKKDVLLSTGDNINGQDIVIVEECA